MFMQTVGGKIYELWESPFPEIGYRKRAESSLGTRTIEEKKILRLFVVIYYTNFFNVNSWEWVQNSVWMAIFVNEGNFVNEGEICVQVAGVSADVQESPLPSTKHCC